MAETSLRGAHQVTEPRHLYCPACGKPLGALTPPAEIKCPRCRAEMMVLNGSSGLTIVLHCVEANVIASRRN